MATEEVIEEWAILWLQSSRSFLIFWATMFMTSTLGIMSILTNFDKARANKWFFRGLTALYFFLVFMSSLSVYSVINNYQMNRMFSVDGDFGTEIQNMALNNFTFVDFLLCEGGDHMIKERINLWILPLGFYAFLYYCKYRQLEKTCERISED